MLMGVAMAVVVMLVMDCHVETTTPNDVFLLLNAESLLATVERGVLNRLRIQLRNNMKQLAFIPSSLGPIPPHQVPSIWCLIPRRIDPQCY
jgi:hypothetical protein